MASCFTKSGVSRVMRPKVIILLAALLWGASFCNQNPVDDDDGPGGGPEPPILSYYFDYPAWHPGGTWIAASHGDSLDTDGDGQDDEYFGGIWLIHATTGTTQPLVKGFGTPAWNPDGTQLAMGAGGQIFTIGVTSLEPARVDTNSLLQLTSEGRNYFPDWSPDGQWIVYDSNADRAYDIWKMLYDGTRKRKLSTDDIGGRIPNWSPDGKYIVHERYFSDANGPPDIVIMDTSGHNAVRLTANKSGDQYPRYSPDGTNPRKVTSDHAWRFDWSPDNKQLVFLYWDTLYEQTGNGELWLVNINGTGLRQLTHYWSIGG